METTKTKIYKTAHQDELMLFFSRSLFCCVKPAVERDLSPPSMDVEVQVKLTLYKMYND